MKTQEEIEKSAIDYAKTQVVRGKNLPEWDDKTEQLIARYFTKGYTQCQQDMADKKYTELQLRFFANELIKGVEEKNKQGYEDIKVDYESLILSLNKQD